MSPLLVIGFVLLYFLVLMIISHFTSKQADNSTFFIGKHQSPWYLVAFGMIGASLSGVTFISVPGWVGVSQFSYMQVVLGYFFGYVVIAQVLMPLYYRLNLISIYSYLKDRFGNQSYKTGASFFLLSRTIGASFRLFLVANVLQILVFNQWGVPFFITVALTILLIWLYTFKGGIKTIVWTDTLQTLFMLIAVGITIYMISDKLELSFSGLISSVKESDYSQIFFFDDWNDKRHFVKNFLSGMFITIVMTGLDQDMMQKNLTCKNITDAKKNMYSFSVVLIFVNLAFLILGALLFLYANKLGLVIPERTDNLFPLIASEHLSTAAGVFFILGLIAAAYSSADSALTSLTTSVCVDYLDVDNQPENKKIRLRKRVHVLMSFVLFVVILIFNLISDESVISSLFKAAGYTYGPLLGLYAFGLYTKRIVKDNWVPIICIVSPVLSFLLNMYSEVLFNGYKFNFEILIVNGFLTFVGLWLISKKKS
ncbi:MAG: sodium:solute symporter [Flavobacteriales bacterium]|nr:sodium:solute symporter [Flavobacteriales bacterium]MCB9336275.1 sodium:solute symporter [Flavobacteriales bacterium]